MKYSDIVEEILFVNTRPALGLQFYMGSNIKYVPLELTDLENEFNEKESRLWVVLEGEEEQFTSKIGTHNVDMQELGSIKAWNNYVLFWENSGNI